MEVSFYSHFDSNRAIAVLSWHGQKFVVNWWPAIELQQGEMSFEFELRAKIVSETAPAGHHKTWTVYIIVHVA